MPSFVSSLAKPLAASRSTDFCPNSFNNNVLAFLKTTTRRTAPL